MKATLINEHTKPELINDIIKSIRDDTKKYVQLCIEMNESNPIFSNNPFLFPPKIKNLSENNILEVINNDEIIYKISEIALCSFFNEDKKNLICQEILKHLSDNTDIIKKTCKELELTQKELAEKLGASEGTVRNWSSSNELPQWALNFIETILEHKKDKEIATKFKELLNLVK
ncbi:hypothetical protein AAX26_01778 [Aliarcobacter thereius]|uniref:helix-turn-helix domain-containing protein n=1 Tax=Aliarcobacter thereius TaxID=544718 RepID=UPI000827BF56|nr:helix-turn-helix transcriptional regulator [Aliarcobacter thereius]OCL85711.1 hypothetical protein AAX26_01778 [Aliarcobacter thereius]